MVERLLGIAESENVPAYVALQAMNSLPVHATTSVAW